MDLLDRLYKRLLSTMASRSTSGDPTLTVADLYQRLIPYRLIRGESGVMELAEYEHALLRLLSGERGYLDMGDPAARLEIQRELDSSNPILGIYRDYPHVKVRITQEGSRGSVPESAKLRTADAAPGSHPDRADESPSSAARDQRQIPVDGMGRSGTPPTASEPTRGLDEARARAFPARAADVSHPSEVDLPPPEVPRRRRCHACERDLPDRSDIVYCPLCGVAQKAVPCRSCGAEVEVGWRFCGRCGSTRVVSQIGG